MKYGFDFSPYHKIGIFPHESPDGDAIGSAVAMSLYLKELGKETYIVIDDEVQYELRFLCEYTEFIDYEAGKKLSDDWDFCVLVDCGDIERIGRRKELTVGKKILNIDHHVTNPHFGDYNIVFPEAPAACEIVYFILKENGFDITKKIGEAIYTGLSTDTGNFLYNNVRPETFMVASELLKIGVDKDKIVFELYQNNRSEKIRLHSEAMSQMTLYQDGKIAITYVDSEMLSRTSAEILDTEGICESMRDVRGVEIACLLKEEIDNEGKYHTKVSMRALGGHDVSEIASYFGGGGHKAAAGFTLYKKKEEVRELLLDKITI